MSYDEEDLYQSLCRLATRDPEVDALGKSVDDIRLDNALTTAWHHADTERLQAQITALATWVERLRKQQRMTVETTKAIIHHLQEDDDEDEDDEDVEERRKREHEPHDEARVQGRGGAGVGGQHTHAPGQGDLAKSLMARFPVLPSRQATALAKSIRRLYPDDSTAQATSRAPQVVEVLGPLGGQYLPFDPEVKARLIVCKAVLPGHLALYEEHGVLPDWVDVEHPKALPELEIYIHKQPFPALISGWQPVMGSRAPLPAGQWRYQPLTV